MRLRASKSGRVGCWVLIVGFASASVVRADDAADREDKIAANRRRTLATYRRILGDDSRAERNRVRRLEANETLALRQRAELEGAEAELRRERVALNARLAIQMPGCEDQGFDQVRLQDLERRAARVSSLEDEVESLRGEVAATEDRVRDLRSQGDFFGGRPRAERRKEAEPSLQEKRLRELRASLGRVSGFRTRLTMSGGCERCLDGRYTRTAPGVR